MKSLRGAYNRIEEVGLSRPVLRSMDAVPPTCASQLLELMTETRQGEAERGYSMTLSRIFDPRDEGLLLAVCFDADGRPLAFNQYVPASEVNGYSLDLMRRTSDPDAPNGLTDFVIIETIAVDGRAGTAGPRAQLRHHAGGGGRRVRRPDPGPRSSVRCSTSSARPCRSSRSGTSTRSTTRGGIPATWSPAPTSRWPRAAWPSPGPKRSPKSRSIGPLLKTHEPAHSGDQS